MQYIGQVKGGVGVFENGTPPEGVKVRVEVVPDQSAVSNTQAGDSSRGPWSTLLELAGTVEGLPSDMARNHDHYIHGAPRKS